MLMGLSTAMCIANLWLEVEETKEHSISYALNEAAKKYPTSILVASFIVIFSIFVVTLCCFHSYLVGINQTTQEKLKHKFDGFPQSPYSYGGILRNWLKVIICPRRPGDGRLSWALFLKSNYPEAFDEHVK